MPRYQIYGASPPFSLRRLALLTIIVSALTAGIAAPALSQGAVLNIATGAGDGRYAEACTQLADDVRGSLTINCLPSPGAEANLKRLSDMEVRDAKNQVLPPAEGAIIQGDTIPYFLKTYPGKLRVNRVSPLFPEAFQLVCNADAGVSYIKDLYGKNKLLAAGGAGTGTRITWDFFIGAEKRYADVALSPLSGPFAVNATKSGEVACTAFVASPGYGSIKTLNEQATNNLVLVTANDGDLVKPKDELGRALYRWSKIPKSVYPNLMKDYWGSADVVVQDSWLVVTKQWAESNEDAYRALSASASRKAREWGAGR